MNKIKLDKYKLYYVKEVPERYAKVGTDIWMDTLTKIKKMLSVIPECYIDTHHKKYYDYIKSIIEFSIIFNFKHKIKINLKEGKMHSSIIKFYSKNKPLNYRTLEIIDL